MNKGYLDMLPVKKTQDHFGDKGCDWPDINPREKTKKLSELDKFVDKRVKMMLNEIKM